MLSSIFRIPNSSLKRNGNIPGTFFVFLENPGGNLDGWTSWNPNAISAYIKISPETLHTWKNVVKHEIGHALHLPHYFGDNKSIMKVPNQDDGIQEEDLYSFCSLWKCQVNPVIKLAESVSGA